MKNTKLPLRNSNLLNVGDVLTSLRSVRHVIGRIAGCAVLLSLCLSAPVLAQQDDSAPGTLKLIELYTSHGCSSCPSADELLGELLAADDQLMALEFHVDYWNDLVHGNKGNFVDPFSKPEFSLRQREYNAAALAGRPGVYTPQAVINGRFATVGSNRRHITKALNRNVEQMLTITVSADDDPDSLKISVTGSSARIEELAGTDISVARYIKKAQTMITGGENSEKTLTNHHIATSLTKLGEVSGSVDMIFTITRPADNEGCVVMVQKDALTPVYAAAECPPS